MFLLRATYIKAYEGLGPSIGRAFFKLVMEISYLAIFINSYLFENVLNFKFLN